MFTGIVESIGQIESIEPIGGDCRMRIVAASLYLEGIAVGDSIAVSGACLTANTLVPGGFMADLSVETLAATTAGHWREGTRVNLERSLTPNKPLGGHLVSGHVDGVGHLLERFEEARSWRFRFQVPPDLARYVARKGSITINGVSLTVNDVVDAQFGVNIIPHTLEHTTLGALQAGDPVNLEVDLIARYLERLLAARKDS